MIKFPSDTELDLERVRTSCAGEQLKLTSEEKDLVQRPRSSKRSNKEDTTGHQRKRGKKSRSVDDLPSTSKQTSEIGRPPVTTELRSSPLLSIDGNSSVGRFKQLADFPPEKHLSAVLETDTCNQDVPITSQPGNLLTPSALPAIELPLTSSASTNQVFPLESFVPTSPGAEISMDVDFLHEIASCNDSSNQSLQPLAITCASVAADTTTNTTTYSALQPVKTRYNFLPSVPSFDVVNTLPGGANLSHINRGLGTPLFPTQPPPFTPSENKSVILNTLSMLLSNQQVILNELEAIREKVETLVTDVSKEGSGSQGMVNNQAPTSSRSENVVQSNIALDESGEIPHLTNEALSQLKNKKIQAKVSPFYFAVVLLNELSTKEMRVGRSVYGTTQKPALNENLVSKVREYFFKAYPCEEEQKEEKWKQCVISMNNRLKKYDRAAV